MAHWEAGAKQNFVALLAEGVDRNKFWGNNTCAYPSSPSSRRAWIEIQNRNFFENRA